MAAKFSMASTGMFDAGDHAEATNRMQNAMEELRVKKEQEDMIKAQEEERKLEQEAQDIKKAIIKENVHDSTYQKAPDYSLKEDRYVFLFYLIRMMFIHILQ